MQRKLTHPVYSLKSMPVPEQDYFCFINDFSGKRMMGYTGTIIRRPGTQSLGILFHYCLFYGFINKIPYVLHNDRYGVECISFKDYMDGWPKYDIVDVNPNNDNKELILKRALEKSTRFFHLKLNNCEHFVSYAACGHAFSNQANMSNIAEGLLMFAVGLPVHLSGDELLINKFNKWKRDITKPPMVNVNKGRKG